MLFLCLSAMARGTQRIVRAYRTVKNTDCLGWAVVLGM